MGNASAGFLGEFNKFESSVFVHTGVSEHAEEPPPLYTEPQLLFG